MQPESDKHILHLLKKGDMYALNEIWNNYADDMLAYIISIGNSRTEAQDILQDVFVTISRKHQSVGNTRKLRPYLFRMCRNHSINIIHKAKRRRLREQHFLTETPLDTTHEENLEQDDVTFETTRLALKKLPIKQSSVIALKFWRKKTFAEIAEMLGISENTVASRYRYGILKLNNLLK